MRSICLAALLAATVSTPALAAGQLPKTVRPTAYTIDVDPDATKMTFTGEETIAVEVDTPTRTITLNAADLKITRAQVDGRAVRFTTDAAAQTLTLTLPTVAAKGKHSLSFAWSGPINTSASGLFATDYPTASGATARMLATQFEAPDARRFAPMFDEPALKATFTVSTVAPVGQTAFSNMPSTSVTKLADGRSRYTFATTPKMSSYLLFLGQGDVERATVRSGATEIGVIARRGAVKQGDYALGAASRLLTYYNDYFGQPYPLPKMDMIAGPGSSQFFSAMENWGAIFYFEPTLLFDPARSAPSARQNVHIVVAHEMAHQWFGDLVTMRWWNDLWLNEGFASWMEGKATAALNPEWEWEAVGVATDREKAMSIDSTAATHPVVRPVETVEQISAAFDSITYDKGQAVIRMLESTLGADPFRAGIRSYMAKYKYGNTATDQLWAELATASGRPVATIAHDFTLQGGVPLVRLTGARCVGGKTEAVLTQGRFGLDAVSKAEREWHVPLTLATLDGGSTDAIVHGAAAQTVSVDGCGTLVLNRGKGSYVRVQYDDATHAALVRDYARLTLSDRVGSLGDDFALAVAGYQDLSRWAALSKQVNESSSPLEWDVLGAELGALRSYAGEGPVAEKLRAYTVATLAPVLVRVGYAPKGDESPLTANLRESLIRSLGAAGDPGVVAEARRRVPLLAKDPTALPPAIRDAMLGVYGTNVTQAQWQQLLDWTLAERDPAVKNRYVRLLGAAKDDAVARGALALLTGDRLTAPQKASLLGALGQSHPDMAFDWASTHTDVVNGMLEASTRATFLLRVASGSNDPAMPGKLRGYAKAQLPAGAQDVAEKSAAGLSARQQTATRLRPAIEAWLK
jgi:aminopeptidase N